MVPQGRVHCLCKRDGHVLAGDAKGQHQHTSGSMDRRAGKETNGTQRCRRCLAGAGVVAADARRNVQPVSNWPACVLVKRSGDAQLSEHGESMIAAKAD